MAGRERIKCAEYTTKGKRIRHYSCIQEALDIYYEGKKRPLWDKHKNIHILPNNNVLTKGVLGKDYILPELRKLNDEFKINLNGSKAYPVALYNVNNERIATFVNQTFASRFTGISTSTIHRQINKSKDYKSHTGLYFKKLR